MLARLSVFAGGATLEAAEQVCDADPGVLAALVERGLVRRDGDRFSLPDATREHAAPRLEESGEAATLRARHAAWYAGLVERATPEIWPFREPRWLAVLAPENANVRAAIETLLAAGEIRRAVHVVGGLSELWMLSSYIAEGRRLFHAVIERASDDDLAENVEALAGGGGIAIRAGEFEEAERYGERLVTIGRERGLPRAKAWGLVVLGVAAAAKGDPGGARVLLEDALALAHEAGDDHAASDAALCLSDLSLQEGDFDAAVHIAEDAQRNAPSARSLTSDCMARLNLASARLALGERDRPLALFRSVLEDVRPIGGLELVAYALTGLAAWHAARDPASAARLVGAANRACRDAGVTLTPFERRRQVDTVTKLVARMGRAAFDAERSAGEAFSPEEATALALGGQTAAGRTARSTS